MLTSEFQNLPKDWQIKTLGEIAQIKGGKRLPKDAKYAETATPYPYIRVTDFENMSVNTTNLKYLTKETQQKIKNYTISKDDVYISIAGSIGKVGTIPDELDNANLTENAAKIIHSMDKKYLAFYLNSAEVQSQIAFFTKATTQPKLALYRIENLKIKVPPLDIQKRIVSKLDEAFSRIDNGTKHLKSAQNNITKFKQSLLKSAFNGTLTATPSLRGSEADEAIHKIDCHEVVLTSRNDDKSVDCHDLTASNLAMTDKENPNLPQGWTIKTLGEVLSSNKHAMKRGPFGSSLKKEFFVDSGIRVFEQYNPINQDSEWKRYFITQEKFKELESFKAGAGDLLISCSGTLGKILELPQNVEVGIINQALLKIRLDNKQILNSYFVHLFNSPNMQKIILENTIGSAIQNIASVKILKQIKIPLPPLQTQKQIVELLEKHFSSADKTSAFIQSALNKAKQLKSSLLKSAFEGKLV